MKKNKFTKKMHSLLSGFKYVDLKKMSGYLDLFFIAYNTAQC